MVELGNVMLLGTQLRSAVERGIPAHLLYLSAERLKRDGYILREDVFINLDRASVAALTGLSSEQVRQAATQIDETATAILRDMSFDDPRDCIISCAYLILKLVDEGLYTDVQNQAVLVATLLTVDSRDSGSDIPYNEAVLKKNVGRMIVQLSLRGFYNPKFAMLQA